MFADAALQGESLSVTSESLLPAVTQQPGQTSAPAITTLHTATQRPLQTALIDFDTGLRHSVIFSAGEPVRKASCPPSRTSRVCRRGAGCLQMQSGACDVSMALRLPWSCPAHDFCEQPGTPAGLQLPC